MISNVAGHITLGVQRRALPHLPKFITALEDAKATDAQFVEPTPATDVILAQFKAGETVYQAGELPKTFRGYKIHYEPPKTVCETPFASIFPPSMENGDGTRQERDHLHDDHGAGQGWQRFPKCPAEQSNPECWTARISFGKARQSTVRGREDF